MFLDIIKYAVGLALLLFAGLFGILTALGIIMFIPYIAQAVLFAMH